MSDFTLTSMTGFEDLLYPKERPEYWPLRHMIEQGFGAEFNWVDGIRRTGEPPEINGWYFKSRRDNQAGHFWLRFDYDGLPEFSPNATRNPALYLGQPWRLEVGDIEIRAGEVWQDDEYSKGVQRLDVLFSFEVWRAKGLWRGYDDTIEFVAKPENESMALRECQGFKTLDLKVRLCLARGLYWLGSSLDQVVKMAGLEQSKHEVLDWKLDRDDSLRQLRVLTIKDAISNRPSRLVSLKEQGRQLLHFQKEMERERGKPVSMREIGEILGKTRDELAYLLKEAQQS